MFKIGSCSKFWLVFLEDMTLLSSSCNYFFSNESKFYVAVSKCFILKLIPEICSSESFNYNMMDIMAHRVNKKDKDGVVFTKFQKDLNSNLKLHTSCSI